MRRAARDLVRRHGTDTLAYFKLRRDEHYLFSADGRAFLGYRVEAGVLLVSGDPVGAEDAIPVLRRSDLGPIGELLLDLHQWMAVFDARSVIELDYGELCDFMTWDELDDDHSAADLREALDALERHEYGQSADVYQGVLTRWAEVRSREIMN